MASFCSLQLIFALLNENCHLYYRLLQILISVSVLFISLYSEHNNDNDWQKKNTNQTVLKISKPKKNVNRNTKHVITSIVTATIKGGQHFILHYIELATSLW